MSKKQIRSQGLLYWNGPNYHPVWQLAIIPTNLHMEDIKWIPIRFFKVEMKNRNWENNVSHNGSGKLLSFAVYIIQFPSIANVFSVRPYILSWLGKCFKRE